MLLSGTSVLGKHLRKYYLKMQREVHGDTEYDSMDGDSPFKVGAAGAGSVKHDVVERPQ